MGCQSLGRNCPIGIHTPVSGPRGRKRKCSSTSHRTARPRSRAWRPIRTCRRRRCRSRRLASEREKTNVRYRTRLPDQEKATYSKIELRAPNIRPRIRSLYDHRLPANCTAREGELIALAALGARRRDRREAVRQVRRDGPWALVRAHVRRAPAASRSRRRIAERLVFRVAALDCGVDAQCGEVVPGAGRLAAVPIASGGALSRGLGSDEGGAGGEEGCKGEGGEGERHFWMEDEGMCVENLVLLG